MKKVFVVTNIALDNASNYIPSVFSNEKAAREWLKELVETDGGEYDANERKFLCGDGDTGNYIQMFECVVFDK